MARVDPLKYLFEKLVLKLDIVIVVRKAIKCQAIADYLADQPLNDLDFSESLFSDKDVNKAGTKQC